MATTKSKVTKTTVDTQVKEEKATSTTATTAKRQYKVKKNLDPNMIVTVRNGANGILIYKSRKTHETFRWECFGDEQDMELQELKNARNSSKAFFQNNWFLIDDPEVIEYLGVEKFYQYALDYDSFNDLFNKEPNEIKSIISGLSNGQKKTIAYRAKQLITDGVIDSIKVINALEESLSIELIEK